MVSLSPGEGTDVVVPSAHPLDVLDRTLPALATAVDLAGVDRRRVVLCDDGRQPRPEVEQLAVGLGFRYLPTGGLGAGPARNAGAASATGEFLLFVDDDVVVDPGAVVAAHAVALADPRPDVVVGGLRPPEGGPTWWGWSYADTTLTPAAAAAGDAELPAGSIASALVLVRRTSFDAAGGFPDVNGIEDALFGLRLAEVTAGEVLVLRRAAVSGVHLYSPTWDEWLRRSAASGARLRRVVGTLDERSAARLIASHRLDASLRGRVKRALGYLPLRVLRLGRGRLGRRIAAAGAEARGWRLGAGAAP